MPEPTSGDSPSYPHHALAEVERRRIDRPGDRWVHAVANVGFGLLIGLWIGPGRLTYEEGANFWAMLVYLLLLIGLATWQTRAARTWPRGARVISYTGAAGCILVGAIVHMALNWYAQEHPLTLPLLLAAAGVIALPLIISGTVLAIRRPR